MERSVEEILSEILEWDRENQEKLVGVIRRNLAERDESRYVEDYRQWQARQDDEKSNND
jgi:hypothetical protein